MSDTAPTKKKVLIVDDEKDLREALKTALTYESIETLTAEGGEEGLFMALQEKPDLILLDIMMPQVSGIDVLTQLRQDAWGKDAQVIMLTASDDMEKVAAVMELRGSEYILKTDVSLSQMVAKVKEKLGV